MPTNTNRITEHFGRLVKSLEVFQVQWLKELQKVAQAVTKPS